MLSLDEIRDRLAHGRYTLTDHAMRRIVERNISEAMIHEAELQAEIIEDYPIDKFSPSCLLLGFTAALAPLHVHVSRARNPTTKIITLYVPDPGEWIDHRIRRSRS